jgi:hypothetical protein
MAIEGERRKLRRGEGGSGEQKSEKGDVRSDAKKDHGTEVVGKRSSIYGVGFLVVPGMHGIETKLPETARIAADEFDLIDRGRKLADAVRLKHPDEDHCAIGEHVPEGDVFAGEIVPGEIGFFDEEDLGLIPARNFDAIAIGTEERFRSKHGRLREMVSRFQARESRGRY